MKRSSEPSGITINLSGLNANHRDQNDERTPFSIAFENPGNDKIIAVIPAYREDRFIGSVVLKARTYVDHVIVVDDGSPDQTAIVAQEAGAEVIVHSVNQGKAKALTTGFQRALELGAGVVVILDGDGQHNPAEIPQVIAPIVEGRADMVIGSRFQGTKSKIPVWRQFGQHSLTLMTNVASGVASTDSQSGFRAFARAALSTFNISARGFSVESEMQFWAREQRLRIVEAPISVVYAERAKRSPIAQGLQVINGILQLVSQMRPLLCFGLTGLLITLFGIGVWYDIVRTYNATPRACAGPCPGGDAADHGRGLDRLRGRDAAYPAPDRREPDCAAQPQRPW